MSAPQDHREHQPHPGPLTPIGDMLARRERERGVSLPARMTHPKLWSYYINALRAREVVEHMLGVNGSWGTASQQYGTDVRAWPVDVVEVLALAEQTVRETRDVLWFARGGAR